MNHEEYQAQKRAEWPAGKQVFLEVLARCGVVTEARGAAGLSNSTVYYQKDADEDFAAAWEIALFEYQDTLRMRIEEKSKTDTKVLLRLGEAHLPEFQKNVNVNLGGQEGNPLAMVHVEVDISHLEGEDLSLVGKAARLLITGKPQGDE